MSASVVVAVQGWLQGQLPNERVLTRTTADFLTNPRQVRLIGTGGPQKLNLASARFIVETFDTDELSAINLAFQVNDLLAYTMRGVVGSVVISRVDVDSVPSTTPYANPNISQQVARYTAFLRPSY